MALLVLPGCALLVAVVVCATWKRIIAFLRDRRRRIALGERIFGLPALPLIGNIHQLPVRPIDYPEFLKRESHRALAAGESVMRVWVGPQLSVFPLTGEALKDVLESQTEIKKGIAYDMYKEWLGEGLLTSYDEMWRAQRKLLTPTFHFRHLNGYLGAFNQQSKKFVEGLEGNICKSGDANSISVDLYPLMALLTLDVFSATILGIDLVDKAREIERYEKAIKKWNYLAFVKFANPLYHISALWYASGYGFQMRKTLLPLKGMSRAVIRERLKTFGGGNATSALVESMKMKSGTAAADDKPRTVFLDMLLEMHADEKLSLHEVQEQVDTFMFAGHDTTAHTLSWFLWCMACHADVQERLHREIVEHFPPPAAADDDDGEGEEEVEVLPTKLNELKYMDQCLKETLRLFAPVPALQRDLRHEMTIGGKLVPKDCILTICPMVIHNNYKVYANHDAFEPENFAAERAAGRHPYDYIPFSAGPRNCIGQKFALLEMKVFIVHFFRAFRLSANAPFLANRPRMETLLVPDLGVPVTVHRRLL